MHCSEEKKKGWSEKQAFHRSFFNKYFRPISRSSLMKNILEENTKIRMNKLKCTFAEIKCTNSEIRAAQKQNHCPPRRGDAAVPLPRPCD